MFSVHHQISRSIYLLFLFLLFQLIEFELFCKYNEYYMWICIKIEKLQIFSCAKQLFFVKLYNAADILCHMVGLNINWCCSAHWLQMASAKRTSVRMFSIEKCPEYHKIWVRFIGHLKWNSFNLSVLKMSEDNFFPLCLNKEILFWTIHG